MFGVVLLALTIGIFLDDANAADICFEAKICIHNGVERCGVDSKGNARRFLDACDIKEYNCIKSTDYVKTDPGKCKDLPPLENNHSQLPDVNKYWCWRSSICRGTRIDRIVCAKYVQRRTRVFKEFVNQCSVFKRNCASRTVAYRLWNMFHGNDLMIGFISFLLLVQHNLVAAEPDEGDEAQNTALLVSKYYCHRLRSCKSPANGPICGYSEGSQYLSDFPDECAMFRTNCESKGRVVFYMIEKEICYMKRKYDEEHKNAIFEWERISRVTMLPSPTPSGFTQPPHGKFSQRMKLVMKKE